MSMEKSAQARWPLLGRIAISDPFEMAIDARWAEAVSAADWAVVGGWCVWAPCDCARGASHGNPSRHR